MSIDGATTEIFEKIRIEVRFFIANCKNLINAYKKKIIRRNSAWCVVQKDNVSELKDI